MQSVKSNLQSIFHQYDDIQELFFQGDVSSFDINARDSHGKTLLHHACEYGLTEGVSILLANNAQADIRDEKGYTPLHYACQNNHIHYDILKIVIQMDPYLTLPLTQGGGGSGSTPAVITSLDMCNRRILHYACIHGDFDIVDELLKAGADSCVQDKLGNSPMHYACENGHLQCVRKLIAISRNPNGLLQIPNNDGVTPLSIKSHSGGTILHIACENLDVYVVAKLLEAGADVNSTDVFGFTPLMRAVIPSRFYTSYTNSTTVITAIITTLCNSKCNVNATLIPCKSCSSELNRQYSEGSTALHIATDNDSITFLVINALIHNGATLYARDVHGRTPLHNASMRGHHRLIKLLAPSPESFHFKDNDGCTPLYYACKNSHLECIRACFVQCPNVISDLMKVANNDGTTPLCVSTGSDGTILHAACDKGDINLVKMLLEAGADPHAQDKLGNNPMHYACENCHLQCMRQLIATSQNPNGLLQISNNDGVTPLSIKTHSGGTILHIACENLDVYVAAKLLEAGADVNSTDVFGFTPLMRAVMPSSCYKSYTNSTTVNTAIITTLCNSKCNVNATLIPCKSCSSELNRRYSEGSTALHIATDNDSITFLVINALIHNGATLYARDVHGRTPLHIASMWGHHHLIKLLAPSPESLHIKNDDYTPLYFPCKLSYFEAFLNVRDNHGCSPLIYACKNSQLECIQAFIDHCPENLHDLKKIDNNDGTTPLSVSTGSGGTILHVACDKGNINLVKKLLEAGADPNVTDEFGFTPLMRAVVSTRKSGITTEVVYSIITALCKSKSSVNVAFVPSKPSDSSVDCCEGSTALHMVLDEQSDNRLCVQVLIDNGAALDAKDIHGRTPLHIASMQGYHHLIKLLAPSPESFHFKDNDGCTPIYYACKNSHVKYIRKCFVQCPNVISDIMKVDNDDGTAPLSVRTGSGGTILHVACEEGDIKLVKKLLKAGANPNVTDEFGFTPLMRGVVSTGKSSSVVSSIITALCDSKCSVNTSFVPSKPSDTNVRYCEGSTALHMAIDGWTVNQLCVQELVDNGAALDARDVHGRTPLHIASMRGYHKLIELLAPSPQSFHFKDNEGCTPLHYASKNSHFECIRKIILQAPSVFGDLMKVPNNDDSTPLSVRTGSGGTILHVACDKGEVNLVKKLLEAGADPNVTDKYGFTPLMRAVVSTRKSGITTDVVSSIITALCDSKCRVNASFVPSKLSDSNVRYCEGSTALHMAIDGWTVNRLCIRELVDNGAALDARDVHGRTPLHIASMRGHHYLIKLSALSPKFFHFKDNEGCIPLHYACKSSHLVCVREFIVISDLRLMKVANNDGTTPLSVRTHCGGTILHPACDKGDNYLVKKLLEAGADPNVTDEFGFTPLMRAVVSTNKSSNSTYAIISALCNSKCSVNAPFVPSKPSDSNVHYCEGSTALHMAIDEWTDNQLYVRALVDNGAALDSRDVHGRTPLHIACLHGYQYLTDSLDPNHILFLSIKDNNGCTPLYYACKHSHLKCIQAFIDHCPDIISDHDIMKIANNDGTTPLSVRTGSGGTILHVACDNGDINLVKKLLEAGADPNVTDEFGFTPLMRTVLNTGVVDTDMSSIVTILCNSGCNVNSTFQPFKSSNKYVQWKGTTALYMAVDRMICYLLCVKAIIDNGATVDVTDTQGCTPLHIASMRGQFRLIKLLTPSPEFSCLKDNVGCTPLYYACKNSHLECIREFIVSIPDVIICDLMKVADKYGTTPLSVRGNNDQTILHIACEKGDNFIIKKVLEAGADPNSLNRSNFTPLMLAVQHVDDVKAADIIAILCEFDCDLNIQASKGFRSLTALHLACELRKKKCIEILVAKGANVLVQAEGALTPLHLVCRGGYHTLISFLITEETVNSYDYYKYWTPLHYACGYHHIECARMIVVGFSKLLLQTHTEYNLPFHSLRDQDGKTILHHACLRNDVEFVENLLNLGADPNVQDNKGTTPLMSALQCHGSNVDINLLSIFLSLDWKPDIKDSSGQTALHYSAKCDDIQIPLMLISAGCDVTAVDNCGQTFSDLISQHSLRLINKQLLRIDRRHIICVVGYPKCGKTTIIAAFQQSQQNRGKLQRFIACLKFNTRVTLDNSRTSGIDTKVITTKRLGSLIFFDFAGQSEYYVSHLAFLESALSAKGSTITFIMMVDLRCSEEDRIAQCKEWLFPIKSILKDHNMLNVILIGSHLDQVGSVSTSTSSLRDTLSELKRTLGTPQMQFIDCWGMDCRQWSSKGMTNLQSYLQSTHPAHNTSVDLSQVPLGACLLFDRLKKSENPPLAITPSKIKDKLKDGRPPFPLTVKYIDGCCQDLAASGLVLYIPNREDAGESWLILEVEEILSRIHGKLFAPDSSEFPMHHKNLANQFGLVHVEELTLAFKDSPLDPEMVQKLLTAMEFCHPVDSSLMTEGVLDGFFSKVSSDLQCHKNLLFFPSLVKANEESVVLSTKSDIPGDDCHWVCWEASTVKPHFLHPRFQQAVFIRLACNYVQKHKSDLSTVEKHSCTVSKNAMSWSTIHGVDVCVQIMHKSTIKVLARSRPGVKVSSLMEMFSSVVSDVLTVRTNHAPGVDAYSVFRVMEKGTPGEHTVPVSSIIDVVQGSGMFVNSRESPPKLVSLKDLFLDWEISVTLLEKMVIISKKNHDPQVTAEEVSEDTHSGPVMTDEHYHESELHFAFICLGFILLFIFNIK